MIQTESYGRAWYINPKDGTRYYLRNGDEAFRTLASFGLGITNMDLAKIPERAGDRGEARLINRLKGLVLLQVESRGEAWYVNPGDGMRYPLRDGNDALVLMRRFGVPVKDAILRGVPISSRQVAADYAFLGQAYIVFDGKKFSYSQRADAILPLASLTKLMTALVLRDAVDDWNKEVAISGEIMDYPKLLVGDDTTSEVGLAVGDRLTRRGLFTAMLVSSSNQATIALVRSLGLSDSEFVARMNAKARELGLLKTRFEDPTGLEAHNVSTAKETARLAHAAFADIFIAQACGLHNTSVSIAHANGERTSMPLVNRNYSLIQMGFDQAKTGYLVEAKSNVVVREGSKVGVVLHADTTRARNVALKSIMK